MIPNFNEEKGLPYGVISGRDVPGLVNDIFMDGENVTYTRWCEEVSTEIRATLNPRELAQSGETREERWDYMCDVLDNLGFNDPRNYGVFIDLFEELEEGTEAAGDVAEHFIEFAFDGTYGEDEFLFYDSGTTVQLGWLGGAILVWVIDSDYRTWAKECSPCVPGAGDLNNPTNKDSGFPCLSLPPDWYEDDVPRIVEDLDYV